MEMSKKRHSRCMHSWHQQQKLRRKRFKGRYRMLRRSTHSSIGVLVRNTYISTLNVPYASTRVSPQLQIRPTVRLPARRAQLTAAQTEMNLAQMLTVRKMTQMMRKTKVINHSHLFLMRYTKVQEGSSLEISMLSANLPYSTSNLSLNNNS